VGFLTFTGRLEKFSFVLKFLPWLLPLPFVANSVAWYIAEGGRQPWIVVGLQKTAEAVSPNITGGEVWLTMIGFTVIYLLLAIAALYAALRFIRRTKVTQAEGRN
jgi:cytochrome d ubiquinol oxidase subunit I